jgi:ADP-heptose:LPS heptosyltransferase
MGLSILIFRIGQLGDTIIALPAMWALRKHFANARMTLLSDQHPGKSYVVAADLLKNTGIFDSFETYPVDESPSGAILRPLRMAALLYRLRKQRFDAVAYLAPSSRTRKQIERDRRFFAAAGVRSFIGMNGFDEAPVQARRPLTRLSHEADQLLSRLDASFIPVPAVGHGCMDLGLTNAEADEVDRWRSALPHDKGKRWIGIGPGSKMPAKRWALDRFAEMGLELVRRFDLWPVAFGGTEDRAESDQILRTWQCGYNAAGALSLRASAAALARCALYVGNDTGTMHLAAATGVPCVAIFSSRDWPGKWHPYGVEHRVLRSQIECEGCGLTECRERSNECLNRIQVREVIAACEELLAANYQSKAVARACSA